MNPPDKKRWTRAEYDELERLIRQKLRYRQIGQRLGRSEISVKCAAYRIGMRNPTGKRWAGHDWPLIDPKIQDLIECQKLSAPQIAEWLTKLGQPIHASTVYDRIAKMPADVRRQAKQNARQRLALTLERNKRKAA